MKQKTYITEELSKEDIKEIRKAIRMESFLIYIAREALGTEFRRIKCIILHGNYGVVNQKIKS